ncbi:MAG: hypothetical protein ACPGLV_08740 [Bacteroidia bacterium]
MNFWENKPNRDEALDKVYEFLKLLSENKPDEAEKLVRVGNMAKFRDALHYHLSDYSIMIFEDKEYMQLPDDFSVGISDPNNMNENDIEPRFSGNTMVLNDRETIKLRVGLFNEITPINITFMIHELDQRFYLNLMKVERE